MQYQITWEDREYDTDSLTLLELETLEQIAEKGYGEVNPYAFAGDFAALVTVFAVRDADIDPADVMTKIAGLTLGQIRASLKPV